MYFKFLRKHNFDVLMSQKVFRPLNLILLKTRVKLSLTFFSSELTVK